MIKLIYSLPVSRLEEELEFLKEIYIFPSHQLVYNLTTGEETVSFGMIVNPEHELIIKLRHKIQLEDRYEFEKRE